MKYIILIIIAYLLIKFRAKIFSLFTMLMEKKEKSSQQTNMQENQNNRAFSAGKSVNRKEDQEKTVPPEVSIAANPTAANSSDDEYGEISAESGDHEITVDPDLQRKLSDVAQAAANMSYDDEGVIAIKSQTQILGQIIDQNGVSTSDKDGFLDIMGMLYAITLNVRPKLLYRSRIYKFFVNGMRVGIPDPDDIYSRIYLDGLYDTVLQELENTKFDFLEAAKRLIVMGGMNFGWDNQVSQILFNQASKSLSDISKIYPQNYNVYSHPADKSWLATDDAKERNHWHCLMEDEIEDLMRESLDIIMSTASDFLNLLSSYISDEEELSNTLLVGTAALIVKGTRILSKDYQIPDSREFIIEMLKNANSEIENTYPSLYRQGPDFPGLVDYILSTESERKSYIEKQYKSLGFDYYYLASINVVLKEVLSNPILDKLAIQCKQEKNYNNWFKIQEAFYKEKYDPIMSKSDEEMEKLSVFYGLRKD